jgi:hypothetical protein
VLSSAPGGGFDRGGRYTFTVLLQLKPDDIRLKVADAFFRIAKKLNISGLVIRDGSKRQNYYERYGSRPARQSFIEGPYSHANSSKAYPIRFRAFGGSFNCGERSSGMPIFRAAETGRRMENPDI